jgi:hypothetical protein
MGEAPLILSVIALGQFFSDHFPKISWYPFWYLGNPYNYLIGPVVPIFMMLFELAHVPNVIGYLIILVLSIIFGGYGIYLYIRSYKVERGLAILSALIFVVLPAMYLVLQHQNGLKHIAISYVPFFLILSKKYLVKNDFRLGIGISLLTAFILLINSSAMLAICIALTAFVFSLKKKEISEEIIIKNILFILLGVSLSTFWYTPGYWWVIMVNPSVGGIPLVKLFVNFIQGALQFLPLIFALWIVKWRTIKFSEFQVFALFFSFTFLILSLTRFLLDPDFIMDWTGFVPELQMSSAFILAAFGGRLVKKKTVLALVSVICIIISVFTLYKLSISTMDVSQQKYVENITKITDVVRKDERIFLSGSPVFWINEKREIAQARGVNDMASIHKWWTHGAYQIREGKNAALASYWLRIFGASYILVHDDLSKEKFRDFKNIEKYADNEYFEEVVAINGDHLYRVKGSSIARIVDNSLLQISPPKNGVDTKSLSSYISAFKKNIKIRFDKANEISMRVSLGKNEVVSLAVAYDARWKVVKGEGKVVSDAMSNIVIIPENPGVQDFALSYSRSNTDWLIPMLFVLMAVFLIYHADRLRSLMKKFVVKVSVGLQEEEKDY